MSLGPGRDALETERLVLRPQQVDDAAVFHQLWTERDPRVPPHRQLRADGRPSVADIAAQIRDAPQVNGESGHGRSLLTVRGTR